jgi:hypothetical protein
MDVVLTAPEMAELFLQPASTRGDGGYQGLLVGFQDKIDQTTGRLTLTQNDIERIGRYAFDYGNGGWENRLATIFGRTLGPKLGR